MDTVIAWMKSPEGQIVGWTLTIWFAMAGGCTWGLGRKLQTLGRIRMKKKYRFHQVLVGEGGEVEKILPIVLGETNSFRGAEKLRNTLGIPGMTMAVVFEPESEVANASN